MSDSMRVGVVGAGTMGAGIALVALQAGLPVVLCDVQEGVLQRAKQEMERRLARRVEKGELTADVVTAMLGNLRLSTEMAALADAAVVIEAVPERMSLKQSIFAQLDEVCQDTAILATNTSSLSITEIAAQTQHPHRVVGMHFFNPAPVMKLVEVVVGEETSAQTVEAVVNLAEQFGKTPAVCKDTPGFIVNRVARNFYGEALRVVGDGTASTEVVDRLMHGNARFPLGPFSLMDMIGIDVNFDVTTSVYEAFYGEPRYRPHPIQARKVAVGQLGRKSGRGFYRYDDEAGGPPRDRQAFYSSEEQQTERRSALSAERVYVVGDTPLAASLRAWVASVVGTEASDCGLVYEGPVFEWDSAAIAARCTELTRCIHAAQPKVVIAAFAGEPAYHRQALQAVEQGLTEDALLLTSLAGPSATEQASWLARPARVRGFATVLPLPEPGRGKTIAWTRPLQADAADALDDRTVGLLQLLGWTPLQVRDGAGGVVMRILAMVLNEAAEALREGVAKASDMDAAMKLGTRYPLGPVQWMKELGIASVWQTVNALWRELGDDRYRPSPLLRQWWYARKIDVEEGPNHA